MNANGTKILQTQKYMCVWNIMYRTCVHECICACSVNMCWRFSVYVLALLCLRDTLSCRPKESEHLFLAKWVDFGKYLLLQEAFLGLGRWRSIEVWERIKLKVRQVVLIVSAWTAIPVLNFPDLSSAWVLGTIQT